jgi:hypothetical protein
LNLATGSAIHVSMTIEVSPIHSTTPLPRRSSRKRKAPDTTEIRQVSKSESSKKKNKKISENFDDEEEVDDEEDKDYEEDDEEQEMEVEDEEQEMEVEEGNDDDSDDNAEAMDVDTGEVDDNSTDDEESIARQQRMILQRESEFFQAGRFEGKLTSRNCTKKREKKS